MRKRDRLVSTAIELTIFAAFAFWALYEFMGGMARSGAGALIK